MNSCAKSQYSWQWRHVWLYMKTTLWPYGQTNGEILHDSHINKSISRCFCSRSPRSRGFISGRNRPIECCSIALQCVYQCSTSRLYAFGRYGIVYRYEIGWDVALAQTHTNIVWLYLLFEHHFYYQICLRPNTCTQTAQP